MISFNTTDDDARLIFAIAKRAKSLCAKPRQFDSLAFVMDVTACHANGCPLKLAEWLAADDFNFLHDAAGIQRHIDRTTGKLGDCFWPRFAVKEETKCQ